MKQEHWPYDIKTFTAGADSDTEPEFLGATDTGDYIDMQNGTPSSVGGKANGVRKIGGEVIVYPNNLPAGDYQCLIERQVLTYHVEAWADRNVVAPSLIRVNGTIVLQSSLFPITVLDPPQMPFNEKDGGGEICFTAKSFVPLVFNVKDLVDSLISDPNKYFSAFDPKLYDVNLYQNLDTPVYREHVNVGTGGGLPVGNVQYRIRLSTQAGDRTNFSIATPMIPVVENMSGSSDQYPYSKTYGNNPNPLLRTRYGIHLQFRVTNLFNYDFVEILRTSWSQGAGIGFNPTSQIVGRIDISPNEISIRDFVDPGDQNVDPPIPLAESDLTNQMTVLAGAKTGRFFDSRLVFSNIKTESKLTNLAFDQIDGSEVHPVIQNIGKPGFGDPYNFVNYRHYTHGERIGLAVNCFDGVFGSAFAQKVTNGTNVQIPNRRDIISSTTGLYSYGGTVKAATVEGTVDQTHEVFDLTQAESKSDTCSFKNIYRQGDTGAWGWKTKVKVTENCDEDVGAIRNHGAEVDVAGTLVYPFYHPYTPVQKNDSDVSGHNYVVDVEISKSNHLIGGNNADYRPAAFGPTYYSQGLLLAGVTNFPDWVRGFSVVRTDVAGRVLAQGLASYFMEPAEYNIVGNSKLCTKNKRKFFFFCPDIENGIVSADVTNDIIDNPEDYSLQFVSPLGFFSEAYNFEKDNDDPDRDRLVDMISYARVIRDVTGGQINPLEDVNMGIDGADGNRYIAYGKWRNTGQQPNTFNTIDGGNRIFSLKSASRITEGRGTYLSIEVDAADIYGVQGAGGDKDFDDQGVKDWTEPVYIVNIVRTGAEPKNEDITLYKQCHFQKMESVIGRGNNTPNQQYLLVDERWEDCISALTGTHPTAATDRFIYIKRTTGLVEQWINVTFKSPAQLTAIVTAIINTGNYFGATGVYRHINQSDRLFTIIFNQPGFYPGNGDLIMVRYDHTAPIRFWGGDATIGESIFAPIDRQADAYDKASNTQFAMGIGFPYRSIKLNPRHYVVLRTTGINRIQDEPWLKLGYFRQLCMMFTVESRSVLPYAFAEDYPLQYFPLINYVMRPNRWDITKSATDQNIYEQYSVDYGVDEITQWKWGGFRFRQNINPEHSNEPAKKYFSEPEFGFQEQTDFKYGNVWSLPRAVNVQNTPGIRTFPANNFFEIDDKSGEIKYLFSAITSKGDNLYVFTNNGTCLLLTGKSILSDLNAGQIAYMSTTSFISGQYWVSRTIGISDEMWKSVAESPIIVSDNGSTVQTRVDGCFFMNDMSMFLFVNNSHVDIGYNQYVRTVSEFISQVGPGHQTDICGVVNTDLAQYWIMVRNRGEEETWKVLMYNQLNSRWVGNNKFRFDKMAMSDDGLYGTRDGETYQLDNGFVMNGDPVELTIDFASSKDPVKPEEGPYNEKEFERVRINSEYTQKPTAVEFYDKAMNLLCFLDNSQGPLYLKRYDGWEQFIPRKLANTNGDRLRLQDRLLIVRVIHREQSPFNLVMAGIRSKPLK